MGEPATPASDRYSLAVVAYELLTGSRPFGGASFAEQALQQAEHEPDPPSARSPGLPPAVDAVILKGLSKDPGARWESAGAFVSALEQALAAAPERPLIDPGRTWYREPPAKWQRRRFGSGALAGAALVMLLTAAAIGIVITSGGSSSDSVKRAGGRGAASPNKAGHRQPRGGPAPAPAAAESPAQLNDQGFQLMQAGRYAEAIPLLERAVAAFPKDSTDLTYAYALYNLGRSLRLAGRPDEAIPVLERRLQFPNQRDVVARELKASRRGATG